MTLEINVIKIDYKRTIERLLSASSIASVRPIGLVYALHKIRCNIHYS